MSLNFVMRGALEKIHCKLEEESLLLHIAWAGMLSVHVESRFGGAATYFSTNFDDDAFFAFFRPASEIVQRKSRQAAIVSETLSSWLFRMNFGSGKSDSFWSWAAWGSSRHAQG